MTVLIDDELLDEVRREARLRTYRSMQRRYSNHNGTKMDQNRRYEIDFIGALGEAAVSSYFDLPWTGRNRGEYDPTVRDVDPYEVKTSDRLQDLWIRGTTIDHREPDQVIIRCLKTSRNTVDLLGWTTLGLATDYGAWNENSGCWIVRVDDLHPIGALR